MNIDKTYLIEPESLFNQSSFFRLATLQRVAAVGRTRSPRIIIISISGVTIPMFPFPFYGINLHAFDGGEGNI